MQSTTDAAVSHLVVLHVGSPQARCHMRRHVERALITSQPADPEVRPVFLSASNGYSDSNAVATIEGATVVP